ncbi:lanthionine synthetase LanC family protein [Nocardioides sediminis]|uniref:lanthionine synthetase LanC family protein n=1 Tax=Nocardioides sediminis TaxID=433648 RepID=UPI000D3060C3|nr:lanthionine synthetase LanC family protein [Nocardioides sediminis]
MSGAGIAFERAAHVLGGRLAGAAVHHEGRCAWLSFDVDESNPAGSVIETSTGPDLYGGTAGIALALSYLASGGSDPVVAAAARGGLRHALANVGDDVSLQMGRAGVALAALVAGRLLEDADIVAGGADLAREVADVSTRGSSTGEWDLIAGDAGIALALTSFAEETADPDHLGAAVQTADRLADAGLDTSYGTCWPSPSADAPGLVGLGHGTSGAALALATVADRAGRGDLAARAADALRYERVWSHAMWGWPDLRGVTGARAGRTSLPYPTQWCHGSAGAGIARARMLRLPVMTGLLGESCLTEVAAAVEVSTTTTLRQLATPDTGLPNLSICHGVGSVAELHLECHLTSGDQEHLDHARRLTLAGLGVPEELRGAWLDGSVSETDLAAPLERIACGLPGGPEVPGLMLGLAGVVVLLLRLADPASVPAPGLGADTADGSRTRLLR